MGSVVLFSFAIYFSFHPQYFLWMSGDVFGTSALEKQNKKKENKKRKTFQILKIKLGSCYVEFSIKSFF
jgi:hypothetical protein